ncbi:MAG: hypothetical protein ABR915_23340 [Thermoguttaceae bacterium]|jgi:hypothetical protein
MRQSLAILILGVLVVLNPLRGFGDGDMPQTQKGGEQYIQWTRDVTAALLKSLDTFTLRLEYHGPASAEHRPVFLSVQPAPSILPPSYLTARIEREEAAAIIRHLAASGFLYRGSINREKLLAAPKEPYFTLDVSGNKNDAYFEHVPWTNEPYDWHWMKCPPLRQQIDALRRVVIGDAAKTLDKFRKQLDKSPPAGALPQSR